MKLYTVICWMIFVCSTTTVAAQIHITGGEPTFGPQMVCSIDFEVKPWADSTNLKFLVVTVEKPLYIDTTSTVIPNLTDFANFHYWHLNDFHILQEGSRISPIRYENTVNFDSLNLNRTYIMQGLFLVDEVNTKSDSVVLILETQSGYQLQSMTYFNDQSFTLQLNRMKELDPTIPSATKKWYRKTLKRDTDRHKNPRSIKKQ